MAKRSLTEQGTKVLAMLAMSITCMVLGSVGMINGWELESLPRIAHGITTLGVVMFLLTLPMVSDLWRAYLKSKKREDLPHTVVFLSPPWSVASHEVCDAMAVHPARGLSVSEARARLARHGENVIDPFILPGFIPTFVKEIYEPTQLMLLSIGVLYATFGSASEALVCFFVIMAMAIAEVATEWKAKRAIALLKNSVPRRATVVRESQRLRIAQQHVVPGDIVLLQAGMEVPADLRLIESSFLEVDESGMTGESTPVPKDATLKLPTGTKVLKRTNVVFAGSRVTRGVGRGVAYATGARTDAGRTLKVARKGGKEKKTALQSLMKQVAGILTVVALGLSAIGALLGLVRGMDWQHIILAALSLAFATIPEELPILIAAVLAVGARSLSIRNIYVKRLRAAENLGYVDTVLTDKTGTLTENRLTLRRVVIGSLSLAPDTLKGYPLPAEGSLEGRSGEAASGPAGLFRLLDAWIHMSAVGDETAGTHADVEGPGGRTPLPSTSSVMEERAEDLEAPLLGSVASEGPLADEIVGDEGDPFDRAVLKAIGGMGLLRGSGTGSSPGGSTAGQTYGAADAVGHSYRQKVTSQILQEVPFDPATKASSRLFRAPAPSPSPSGSSRPQAGQPSRRPEQTRNANGERTYFKGAPETLLASCRFFAPGDADVDATELRSRMQEQLRLLGGQGLRLIGYASCEGTGRPVTPEGVEIRPASPALDLSGATFLGVLAFEDPVREGAADAVRSCQMAGVHVVMVTGDHSHTAVAIAREVGILGAQQLEELDGEGAVSCSDTGLGEMDDEMVDRTVSSAHVFARATPVDKLAILQSLQRQGHVVVATGDGTNDAPVLSTADVGMAMGTSTDVAREACGIVILDDDFSSLVAAIAEGRRLLSNLRKALAFYLGAKAGLVLLFVIGTLYSRFPLAAIQILVLELFMDVGASASFVMEPAEADAMMRPPRPLSLPFFDTEMLGSIATAASSILAGVLSSFICGTTYGLGNDSIDVASPSQTMAFLGWLFAHVFLAFNMRSTTLPILLTRPFSNAGMNLWLAAVLVTAALTAFVPPFRTALKLQELPLRMWLAVIAITFVGTFWIEAVKAIKLWMQSRNVQNQENLGVVASEKTTTTKDIEQGRN